MRVGGSTRVRTVSFPECIGLDAVLAVGHRPTRNFGEPQKLSRGGSDRLVEVYQPFIGAALASDELVITRGVADYGNDFADRAVTAVRRFSNFTEYNAALVETEKTKYAVDTSVVSIRNAFAHGRLLTSKEIPARLWKFGYPCGSVGGRNEGLLAAGISWA